MLDNLKPETEEEQKHKEEMIRFIELLDEIYERYSPEDLEEYADRNVHCE